MKLAVAFFMGLVAGAIGAVFIFAVEYMDRTR